MTDTFIPTAAVIWSTQIPPAGAGFNGQPALAADGGYIGPWVPISCANVEATLQLPISASTPELNFSLQVSHDGTNPVTGGFVHVPAGGGGGPVLTFATEGYSYVRLLLAQIFGDAPASVSGFAMTLVALPGLGSPGSETGPFVPESAVGAPNGVASLDVNGLVPLAELPVGFATEFRTGFGAPVILVTDAVGDSYFDKTNNVLYAGLTGTLTIGQPWTTAPASCAVVALPTSPPVSKASSVTVPSTYQSFPPAGWLTESIPRASVSSTTVPVSVTGVLKMTAVYLSKGTVASKLSWQSGNQAAVTPLHWWLGLYDDNLNQLATTADQTVAAITLDSTFDIAIAEVNTTPATPTTGTGVAAGTITVPYSGLYYVGVMVVAATMPNYTGIVPPGGLPALAPVLAGNSDVGQTVPPAFPHTATALTGAVGVNYVGAL